MIYKRIKSHIKHILTALFIDLYPDKAKCYQFNTKGFKNQGNAGSRIKANDVETTIVDAENTQQITEIEILHLCFCSLGTNQYSTQPGLIETSFPLRKPKNNIKT